MRTHYIYLEDKIVKMKFRQKVENKLENYLKNTKRSMEMMKFKVVMPIEKGKQKEVRFMSALICI
ncbi:hypothetical protein L3K57_15785 (plasmid) [Enterococcus faecium]|uniref:hypothetical protein n=1 Tax=Enterococcus faecium TaxID=1352 RepID=UPI001F266599|nr:hypothetical protein [Enterococcus faecium]UJV65265.1 hypothetical protein L3K57_15785 [Enterococcus faecium]